MQWTAGRQLGVWDRRPVHRQVRQLRPATPRVGAAWSGPPSWAGRSGRLQIRSDQGILGSGSDRRSDILREGDEHSR
jgi:hypothetical protein